MQENQKAKKKAIYWKQVLRSIYIESIIYIYIHIVYVCFYNMSIYVRDLCVEVEPNVSHVWQLFSNFSRPQVQIKNPVDFHPSSVASDPQFHPKIPASPMNVSRALHQSDPLDRLFGAIDSWIHRSLLSSFGSSTCNQFEMARRFFVEKSHGILSNTKQTYTPPFRRYLAVAVPGFSWQPLGRHEMRAQKRTKHKEMDSRLEMNRNGTK